MVKSNVEKQLDSRERKNLEGPDFLEKDRKRQNENLEKKRIAVKERVQRSVIVRKPS